MTAYYICAGIGAIIACAVCYSLGWCEGRKQGQLDGYEGAAGECRRRCANER